MNHRNIKFSGSSRRVLQLLALVALLTLALPIAAQTRGMQRAYDYERIDAVRNDLLQISDRLVELSPSKDARAQLLATRDQLEGLTDEELAMIAEPLADHLARLNESLESMSEYVTFTDRDDEAAHTRSIDTGVTNVCDWPCTAPYPDVQAFSDSASGDATRSDSTSGGARTFSEEYDIDCNRSLRISFQTRFNLRTGLLIAELIKDIAGRLCDQSVFILGVGTDFSIACIVTDFAYHAVRVFDEFPALCDEIIDAAEIEGSYDRVGYIHDEIETHDGALASHGTSILSLNTTHTTNMFNRIALAETNLQGILSTHDIAITAQLALHDTEVQAAIAAHDVDVKAQGATHDTDIKAIIEGDTAFFMQTSIERALKRRMRLASLYLPEAMGGQAETARQIVVDTIAAVRATSQPINQARYALHQADLSWNYQQYKRSWSWLAKAYREATKILGEPY